MELEQPAVPALYTHGALALLQIKYGFVVAYPSVERLTLPDQNMMQLLEAAVAVEL